MNLDTIGWGPAWDAALAALARPGWEPARVALEDKHAYVVLTAGGSCPAVVPGKMLHRSADRSRLPKVGDWVAVRGVLASPPLVIESVLPRRTQLVRKVAGRTMEEQVMAANVDVAMVVMALDPSFNPRRLERFLVMVREGGVRPVVVLNKADLAPTRSESAAAVRGLVGDAPLCVASAKTGEGMEDLARLIHPGETVVFIGTSGVGKSSLINRLYGDEIQATLEVREGDAKGRHATTWRELIVLPQGGVVIDTPGMREFHMWVAAGGLDEAFPDIETLAVQCHFRSCSHTTEKRCAVRSAVDEGRLGGDRLEGYLKLKHELEYLARERQEHTFQGRRTRRPGAPPPRSRSSPRSEFDAD